ncbi:hypothetical protein SK803_46270 [Lentzea sp. BCCO 10_0856]|uniref:Uncharacterized protein n=1 Tax=Lentzea miocenica TaxID=3095431 RepID=A0ABU4THN5_9PSEU|nr:hypothetical protein [Lentzea sp. BCCO 10_0856]MDX8037646.1 hypothetical protein [Lentzea sp. BCCO 10_0856]
MTAITIALGLVAASTWTWVVGDHFDWWQRAAAHRRYQRHSH